jgi:hypothetical protein
MKKIKVLYIIALVVFFTSVIFSPKLNQIDEKFLFLLLITVAIPLPLLPIFMLSKADYYYQKAEKEGRNRGLLENKKANVEEEYRTDSIVISVLLIFLYVICAFSLW